VRRLLAALVALVVLVTVVDFGAAAYAEYRISREVRMQLGLSADPEVRINGFPFLTQAIAGDYRSVDVRANRVPVPRFGEVAVEATLRGIRLPAAKVLSGAVSSVVADSVDARVRVGALDLGRYLGVPDLEVTTPPRLPGTADSAPRTSIILTGTVTVAGVSNKVSVDASLSLQGGAVAVTATRLTAGTAGAGSPFADSVVNALLSRLSVTIDPSAIPFGIQPTAVRAEGSDIVVAGRGVRVTVIGPTAPVPVR
jgi:hypothetical protein